MFVFNLKLNTDFFKVNKTKSVKIFRICGKKIIRQLYEKNNILKLN